MFYEFNSVPNLIIILISICAYSIFISKAIDMIISIEKRNRPSFIVTTRNNSIIQVEELHNNISNLTEIQFKDINDDDYFINRQRVQEMILQRQSETFREPVFVVDFCLMSILDIVRDDDNRNIWARNRVIELLTQIHSLDEDFNVLDKFPEVHKFIFDGQLTA